MKTSSKATCATGSKGATVLDLALAVSIAYHEVVKDTTNSLEEQAATAKAKLGKDAHLYFLSPKKGGKLQPEDYDVLVATTALQMARSQPNHYGDFLPYVSEDGRSMPAIDSTLEKKTVVRFKGKEKTRGTARSSVRSTTQSRLAKLCAWINPEYEGIVGKKDPEPQQVDKTGLDKLLICVNTAEKIISKADGSFNVVKVSKLVNMLKEVLSPIG